MSIEPSRRQGQTTLSGDIPAAQRLDSAGDNKHHIVQSLREGLEQEISQLRNSSRKHRPYLGDGNDYPSRDKTNGQVVQRKAIKAPLTRQMILHSAEGKSSSEWYSPLDPNPERTALLQSIVGRQPYVDISTGRYVPNHVDSTDEALIHEARCAGALANQLLQYAADAEVKVLKQRLPGNVKTLDEHEELPLPAHPPWSPAQLSAFEYDDVDVLIKGWLVKGHPWSSVEYITRDYYGRPIELPREKLRQKTWEAKLQRETALRHPLLKLDYDSKLETECEEFKAVLEFCPSSIYSSGDTAVEEKERRTKYQEERVEAFIYANHENEVKLVPRHASLSTVEASSKNSDASLGNNVAPRGLAGDSASQQNWSDTGLEDEGPFHPDKPLQSIEDRAINSSAKWKPVYIRRLSPLGPQKTAQIVPVDDMVSFSYEFLKNVFGDGAYQWNEGGTFIIPKKVRSLFQCRLFYLLDEAVEPFLPTYPGEHGAKLTPFFRPGDGADEEDCPSPEEFLNAPVFVSKKAAIGTDFDKKEFLYYGQYSQSRFSDSLDYDRMYDVVPYHVKERWAEILTDNGKAPWIHQALLGHLYPKYQYEGRLPDPKAHPTEYSKDLVHDAKHYLLCLSTYKAEDEMRAAHITKENILQAFEEPDCGPEPGIRLFWEYLECVNWDLGFYNMLADVKEKQEAEVARHTEPRKHLKPAFRPTAPDFSPRPAKGAKDLDQKDDTRASKHEQDEGIKDSPDSSKLQSRKKMEPTNKVYDAKESATDPIRISKVALRGTKVLPPHLRAKTTKDTPAAMPHNMDGIYSSIFSTRPFFPPTSKASDSEHDRMLNLRFSPSLSASPSRRFETLSPAPVDDLLSEPPFEFQFIPAMVPTHSKHSICFSNDLQENKKGTTLAATAPIFCPQRPLSTPEASQSLQAASLSSPSNNWLDMEGNGDTIAQQNAELQENSTSEENKEQNQEPDSKKSSDGDFWTRTAYIPPHNQPLEGPFVFPPGPSPNPEESAETDGDENQGSDPKPHPESSESTKWTRIKYTPQFLRSFNNLDPSSFFHSILEVPGTYNFNGEEDWKKYVWRRSGDVGAATLIVEPRAVAATRFVARAKLADRPVLRANGKGSKRDGYLSGSGSGSGGEGDDERDEVEENRTSRLFNPDLARKVRDELERHGVPTFAKLRASRKKKEKTG